MTYPMLPITRAAGVLAPVPGDKVNHADSDAHDDRLPTTVVVLRKSGTAIRTSFVSVNTTDTAVEARCVAGADTALLFNGHRHTDCSTFPGMTST